MGAIILFVLLLILNGISGGAVIGWFGGVTPGELSAAIGKVQAYPRP